MRVQAIAGLILACLVLLVGTGLRLAVLLCCLSSLGVAFAQMPPQTYVKAKDIEDLVVGRWGLAYAHGEGWFDSQCAESERLQIDIHTRDKRSVLTLAEEGKPPRTAPISYMFPEKVVAAKAMSETAARLMLTFDDETEKMSNGDLVGWSITMRDGDTLILWRWDKVEETVAYKRCADGPLVS